MRTCQGLILRLCMQKSFVAFHPDKQVKKNRGELPKYYARDAHEAIIDRETFDRVQEELKRRADEWAPAPKARKAYPFTGKIICGNCGKRFHRKTVVSPSYVPRIVWICATFNSLGKKACSSKQIPEPILMDIAASVMGDATFDEERFAALVKEIQVPAANRLLFMMADGREIEREWEDHSRRDSWNDENRRQAAQNARKRYAK